MLMWYDFTRNMGDLVSVIITTKNSAKTLETLLISIKNQSYLNYEVVLVDNPNTKDKTRIIAKKYNCSVFIKGPERSAQRNYGVTEGKGEYVLILDSDMVLEEDVIKQCVNKIDSSKEINSIIIPEKSFGERFWVKFKIFEREFYEGDETIEAPRFFKKTVFEKYKGYDEKITGPEDWDLPLRMKKGGEKTQRIKSYIHHNEGRYNPFKSARKKFYYAQKAHAFFKKHPEQITTKGNLIFRPVFFKKWKKLISHPFLSLGLFFIKTVEGFGALAGFLYSAIIQKK